ncbi:exodeoxyribonuclease V subunit alpha [Chlamydia avium]|uniref:Exodeoxyribonuclease V, alpha subunit n=1 Tax=Chlamydia avium TaxID=1457141 RepID=A0ABN0MTF4_9CHLA|nr:exodeoxyribonuclease V subunit alpha [Chlamydia avium]EPP36218.1 exodeoxyribonuclease V, alpha subunit [Chlamydia psittaci 10_743_SC13]EPP38762.1 exodeoxyribonuclease V, alpha subunit [Chlamydia avium]
MRSKTSAFISSLNTNVPSALKDSLQQQYILPIDLAFSKRYSRLDSETDFIFLAVFSSLLRSGYPFLSIENGRIFPSIPGISEQLFYNCFANLHRDLLSSLFFVKDNKIYLRTLYHTRENLFHKLSLLSKAVPKYIISDVKNDLLSEEQNQVFQKAIRSCFSLICGGPGTGKTFLAVQIVLTLLRNNPQMRVAVVTPTGKAASHIRQIFASNDILGDRVYIQTIHHFLQEYAYKRCNQVDLLLVDEGSMVTLGLLNSLVNTLSGMCVDGRVLADNLIILGDAQQLPPIGLGAGNPLQDLIAYFPENTLRLQVSHRAKTDQIHNLSQAILNKQSLPFTPLPPIHQAISMIKEMFVRSSSSQMSLCVLTPMRYGRWGYLHLNHLVFCEMQKTHPDLLIPIMITARYATWGLSNGDTGFLCHKTRRLLFQHCPPIDATTFSHYTYNYVMSVHKSQGSEYDQVIVIVPQGCATFDSSMLYTAITRAKHSVTIWAEETTLRKIIKKQHKYPYEEA